MRHFYIGAEHLFIALLEIKGSLASHIIIENGLTPEYVIDAIRRKVGKGSRHRLWAGIPDTPRTRVLLGIANDIALEAGRKEIDERDLLVAIFEENDSLPMRVLQALGLSDMKKLAEMARNQTLTNDSQRPYVKVDYGSEFDPEDSLSKEHLFILRRMFYGYGQIRVERKLSGGYSSATLVVITPIRADGREDAAVVAKIDDAAAILDEARRYDTLVKAKLPPITARLEDVPVAPESSDIAGIKYTLITSSDQMPQDLRKVMHEWESADLGLWLKNELFPSFGRTWWQQNRPFRFQVWQEYDWLLPPLLTLEHVKTVPDDADTNRIRVPVRRSKLNNLEYGDLVTIENFTVQKVLPEQNMVELAVNQGADYARAYCVKVREFDFNQGTYYRGEVVPVITGRVWKTRHEELVNAVRSLSPDFDPEAATIPTNLQSPSKLPNPIIAYQQYLDHHVNGSLSTIHGDLHPGNIMIGPRLSPFLIDFAHTRDGHTIFDWANLEISLLSDMIMPLFGGGWEDARQVIQEMIYLNGVVLGVHDPAMGFDDRLSAIAQIRQIVRQCLASEGKWAEYFVALIFCGLRALSWDTMPVTGRRLVYMLSGLAIHELQNRARATSDGDTPSPDETDLNTIQ